MDVVNSRGGSLHYEMERVFSEFYCGFTSLMKVHSTTGKEVNLE